MSASCKRKPSPIVEIDDMREFAGHFATGVGVITATSGNREYFGLTMNAITSLSLNPPLYLVCLGEQSNTLAAVLESGAFGINFLRNNQQALCSHFATRKENKFADVAWHEGHLGVPLLDGALATAICRVEHIYPGGDHRIVVGRPEDCQIHGGDPLVYFRGDFLVKSAGDERES